MVEWHQRLDGLEFEQALGDGEGQGSLVCCSPWGLKQLDTTERLNNFISFPFPNPLLFLFAVPFPWRIMFYPFLCVYLLVPPQAACFVERILSWEIWL